jgi:hypothetical protein
VAYRLQVLLVTGSSSDELGLDQGQQAGRRVVRLGAELAPHRGRAAEHGSLEEVALQQRAEGLGRTTHRMISFRTPKNRKIKTMKAASELLVAFLESVSDPEKAAGLFAEHSAFEAPYLATIGLPPRTVGREGVAALLTGLLNTVPTLAFPKPEILIDTGDQAFAEYSVDTVIVDGRPFRQLYATRVVARVHHADAGVARFGACRSGAATERTGRRPGQPLIRDRRTRTTAAATPWSESSGMRRQTLRVGGL